ncbi:hypothetical protein Pmani_031612 [Petrolisthes manimaculis]|uniref:Uncharacterized protein n=1 Tax=Petrolisthes manimaculis TaxID=1843537 RepID=A0AAE1NVA6_9EUCA|nr:hypothetical protein Pmani_031612 [Petrolisthes manimaculis]
MKCRGTQRDCKCCIGTQGPMCGVGSGVIGCEDAYSGTCRTFCAEGESEETRADCGEDPCACCISNRRSQTCTPTYECVSSAEMCTGTVDTENICDCFSSSFCCVTGLENCDGTELKHGDVNKLDATDSSTLHHK